MKFYFLFACLIGCGGSQLEVGMDQYNFIRISSSEMRKNLKEASTLCKNGYRIVDHKVFADGTVQIRIECK